VGIGKRFSHRAEAAKGSTKKVAGRVTGDNRMRAEGRGGQIKGNLKLAGMKVRDAFKR